MTRFMTGLMAGLALGAAGAVVAANIVGKDGYLVGWYVRVGGEVVCSSPYVTAGMREIECE